MIIGELQVHSNPASLVFLTTYETASCFLAQPAYHIPFVVPEPCWNSVSIINHTACSKYTKINTTSNTNDVAIDMSVTRSRCSASAAVILRSMPKAHKDKRKRSRRDDEPAEYRLLTYAALGQTRKVAKLLNKHTDLDINFFDAHGCTALHQVRATMVKSAACR